MEGKIWLHRKITEWEWYHDVNVKSVWFHLMINAQYKQTKWQNIVINRGQLVTSLPRLRDELKMSEQSIRTALKKLEKTGEISKKSTNKFTIITICKWDVYQSNPTDEQHSNNIQTTFKQHSNNNIQEYKEYKEIKEYNSLSLRGDENFEKMKGDRLLIENLCMLNRTDEKTVLKKIDEFKAFCIAGENRHYSVSDLRQHFRDWLRKTLQYERETQTKNTATNEKNQDRRRGNEVTATSADDFREPF